MALSPIKKHENLSDMAYSVIRNAIVFNELTSTDILTEEKLCEELSISRTPLRTALHRLVDEGLAEVRGKSITVTDITPEDIANIIVVRVNLEHLVMNELRGKITRPILRHLRQTIATQKESYMSTADDYVEYIHQDYLFHTALANATGNKFLSDLAGRINTHSNRCLMLTHTLAASHGYAIQEHTAIVDALEKHDYDGAYQAMDHHLRKVGARYLTGPTPDSEN